MGGFGGGEGRICNIISKNKRNNFKKPLFSLVYVQKAQEE